MRRAAASFAFLLAACNTSSPGPSDAKQPEPADASAEDRETQTPTPPSADADVDADADADADPAPAKAEGSCEELEKRWEAEAAKLERACSSKDDCSLLWSDYVCYALRSQSDDVSVLESIDAGMEGRCSTVECEPPPMIACKSGRCDWDL